MSSSPGYLTGRALHDNIVRLGGSHGLLRDFYAALLRLRWRSLLAVFLLAYALVNVLFAGTYLLAGNAIVNARPGSFEDAFAFSVQTLSTVGYGALSPQSPNGNLIVAVESFVGILLVAMATGIVFTKFARPSSGIVLSEKMVVGTRNGKVCLMLRLANSRGSDIVEASIRVSVLVNEITTEGHRMRRFHDLRLERSASPVLLMSWLVIHQIDSSSPLFGLKASDLQQQGLRFVVNVTGMDGTFMQTIYQYAMYEARAVVFDAQFVDIISTDAAGRAVIDLRKLNDVRPESPRGFSADALT